MKNNTFLDSIKCAFCGLRNAFGSERNFKIYIAHVAITLPINILLRCSLIELAIYMICVMGVFSSECLNTAIEQICDLITIEYKETIKFAKDISAGAVLCWGIAFYVVETIILFSHF